LTFDQIIERLHSMANPVNAAGMARFGINSSRTLGVTVADLRKMARAIGRDHTLAAQLWESGIHEARIVAALIDAGEQVTGEQMDAWVREIDSWDICDSCCNNLFRVTPFAYQKAREWAGREEEFVKRAGFVLMATLAVHDKRRSDEAFLQFLSLIERGAEDERNFVKKAVNWALRQIGKRSKRLNGAAIETARSIHVLKSKSARWIARDALRELENEKTLRRIKD
jgi:3-methyladenine DNA glycosylase AlkD